MTKWLVRMVGVALMVSVLVPTAVRAQKFTKGTLSGVLFSAGATANNGSVPLYTAPATTREGVAIITAVCGFADVVNQTISGSTLGNLALGPGDGEECFEFTAGGLPLPPGEVLTYSNVGSFNASVRIIGVLSKK